MAMEEPSGGLTSLMMAVRLASARRWSWYTSRANPLRTIFTKGECSTAKSASARLNPEVLILASAAAHHKRAQTLHILLLFQGV